MLLSIQGDESTGKSTLAYTGPLPIVGFAFDMGAKRAIYGGRFEEFFEGLKIQMVPYEGLATERIGCWKDYDITVFELPQPVQLDTIRVTGSKELWSYFIVLASGVFTDPTVPTLVMDTMTVARRVRAEAHLQSLQEKNEANNERIREKLIQIEYGAPNDAIRNLYTTSAGTRKNLAAVHHLTDERVMRPGKDGLMESVPTGNRILEGLNNTHRFVDVAVLMGKKDHGTEAKLLKCGYDLAFEGTTKENICWDSLIDWITLRSGDRLQLPRRAPKEESP